MPRRLRTIRRRARTTSALTTMLCAATLSLAAAQICAAQDASSSPFDAIEIRRSSTSEALDEPALALHLAERFAEATRRILDDAVRDERGRLERSRSGGEPSAPLPKAFERHENGLSVTAGPRRLISVEINDYVYQGGAHGLTRLGALIWDVETSSAVPWTSLFGKGRAPEALAGEWRRAAIAEQQARAGGATEWRAELDAAHQSLAQTPVAFAPSTAPGKAGGLVFLHEAYQLGPYSDGPYLLTIPLTAFADALSPKYAPFFAGEPAER